MNNNKLLSIMAITAMCLVSCAVLVDFDESDAIPSGDMYGLSHDPYIDTDENGSLLGYYGQMGGFTDNGVINKDTQDTFYEYSDPTHVATGIIYFNPLSSSQNGEEAYIALGSYVSIPDDDRDTSYTAGFGLSLVENSGYDSSTPVIKGYLSKVGDLIFSYDDYRTFTLHVVDTPFDVDGKVFCITPEVGGQYQLIDHRDGVNDPEIISLGLDTSIMQAGFGRQYRDQQTVRSVVLGSECIIDDFTKVISVDTDSSLTHDKETVSGVFDSVGSTVITYSITDGTVCTLTINTVDVNVFVDVSSIDITGQDTVTVGNQITLTAVTGPSDASARGVEWSIISGDGFVSRISSTETATGGTITLQGVSDGVATIRATAVDGSGVYKDFQVTVSTPQIVISSTQGDVSLTTAMSFLYTVQTNVTDCQVLVSGAPWLSVNGNTISGTPTSTGEYDITVTVTKAGYLTATQTFTINVISVLGFSNAPTSGVIVYEI